MSDPPKGTKIHIARHIPDSKPWYVEHETALTMLGVFVVIAALLFGFVWGLSVLGSQGFERSVHECVQAFEYTDAQCRVIIRNRLPIR